MEKDTLSSKITHEEDQQNQHYHGNCYRGYYWFVYHSLNRTYHFSWRVVTINIWSQCYTNIWKGKHKSLKETFWVFWIIRGGMYLGWFPWRQPTQHVVKSNHWDTVECSSRKVYRSMLTFSLLFIFKYWFCVIISHYTHVNRIIVIAIPCKLKNVYIIFCQLEYFYI